MNPSPEAVVQAQFDAYCARDMEAFLATYASDAAIYAHPDTLLAQGHDAIRARYTTRFTDTTLRAALQHRVVMGSMVVDHERVTLTFPEGLGTLDAVATYEVADGVIVRAWLLLGAPSFAAPAR